MADNPAALIIGAGIAGLTLALALARRGASSTILERADHLSEVGAGIQISPNAARILFGLGLEAPLAAVAARPQSLMIRDGRDGAALADLPLGDSIARRHGAPYLLVHRGDLQAILLDAVRAESRITLQLGCCLESVSGAGRGIAANAIIGARQSEIAAGCLVGADGVRSDTRIRLMKGAPPVLEGRSAWRAILPADRLADRPDLLAGTGLWLGPRAHLVTYPIRGGREVNLVAVVDDLLIDDRWDSPADRSDLLPSFAGWHPGVIDILNRPEGWRRWALATVPSGQRWTDGRIALIGDAAHAMLPFAAQGAAMAIEDAAVLARLLTAEGGGTLSVRLAAYEGARAGRVRAVAASARRNASIYHQSGLAAFARNQVMRFMGPERLVARMDWIWGWQDRAG